MGVRNVGVEGNLPAGQGLLQVSGEVVAAQEVRRDPVVGTQDKGVLQDLAALVEVVERKFECPRGVKRTTGNSLGRPAGCAKTVAIPSAR